MNAKIFALAPLSVVFGLALTACCGNLDDWSDGMTLTDAELIALLTPLDTGLTDTALTTATTTGTSTPTNTGTSPTEVPEHTCAEVCQAHFESYDFVTDCTEVADDAGSTTFTCEFVEECVGGRFHQTIDQTPRAEGTSRLGAWLAQMAHDEAASAMSFHALERELRAHGAPSELRQRLLEAARDEVGHATLIRGLAEARGGIVPTPTTVDVPSRELFDIALENVLEGCVQETWLAMRAWVQARQATDPEIGAALTQIAVDETRHAELARELDQWLRSRLGPADNTRLDLARDAAVARLIARIDAGDRPRFPEAGLPSAPQEQQLIRVLASLLW